MYTSNFLSPRVASRLKLGLNGLTLEKLLSYAIECKHFIMLFMHRITKTNFEMGCWVERGRALGSFQIQHPN